MSDVSSSYLAYMGSDYVHVDNRSGRNDPPVVSMNQTAGHRAVPKPVREARNRAQTMVNAMSGQALYDSELHELAHAARKQSAHVEAVERAHRRAGEVAGPLGDNIDLASGTHVLDNLFGLGG